MIEGPAASRCGPFRVRRRVASATGRETFSERVRKGLHLVDGALFESLDSLFQTVCCKTGRAMCRLCWEQLDRLKVLGNALARFAAQHDGHAEAYAGRGGDVFHAETTTAIVAGNVQAGNRLEVGIEGVLLCVGDDSAAGAHDLAKSRIARERVERTILDGEEHFRVATEILVDAVFAELVVLLDFRDERLDSIAFEPELLRQALQRVVRDEFRCCES